MKAIYIFLLLMCIGTAVAAQDNHQEDSTDVFFRHLQLNELTVTGVTGRRGVYNMGRNVTFKIVVPIAI